jgi:uncharacterized damage-inducible protein DinB
MDNIQSATDAMRSTVDEILAEVDHMPPALIHWKPGPQIWTVMDNLCHIEEFIPYWTSQVEQVIARPGQEWGRTHHDADRLTAVADTSTRQLSEVKREIQQRTAQSIAKLQGHTAEQFAMEAPSHNPRWGTKPASFIVDTMLVGHLRSHLGQVRRNLDQYRSQEKFA